MIEMGLGMVHLDTGDLLWFKAFPLGIPKPHCAWRAGDGGGEEGQTLREFYLLTLVSDLSHASPSCIEVCTESGLEVALI